MLIIFLTNHMFALFQLCLTIQYVMENKKPKLTEIFDLSFKQMVGVCVHLSVEKNVRTKDWRDLAEYLGEFL